MAVKRFNRVNHSFLIDGKEILFCCDTTRTETGFCHHVFAYGAGMTGEHSRVKYYNRTWERYDYETVMRAAAAKYPKAIREALYLEIDNIGRREEEKAAAFLKAFEANYNVLSREQKTFLAERTPTIETTSQARAVGAVVGLMAVVNA